MLKEYLKHTKTNAHYYSITSVSETTLVIISNLKQCNRIFEDLIMCHKKGWFECYDQNEICR